ncbi:MAG: hypothetical protein ACTSWY_04390 [Promethearchaeota archaeon]
MARKKKKERKRLPDTFSFIGSGTKPSEESKRFMETSQTQQINAKERQKPQKKQRENFFSTGDDSTVISMEKKEWAEMLADKPNWTSLPFTHGMEMELIICTDDGEYITGDDMVHRMFEIVKEANIIMNKLINYEFEDPTFQPMPEYIRNKIGAMCRTELDEEKGLVMKVNYQLGEDYIDIDSFARDGNVTAITYILELVTPVCNYAEELAYWASTLFNLAKKTLPKYLHILATAFNPTSKEYNRGLSQGDHHHIGTFESELERVQCYDMIRNFIPHLVALSVNSPIINNTPTDVVKVRKGVYTCPNCVRSLRLLYNTTMLSSNEAKHYIPYLSGGDEANKKFLLDTLQKVDLYDARYQDVFPWTEFGTIEVRIMDAQISICRRIGLGMLVQALCYKARKLVHKGNWVPDCGSETITDNRKCAIERGLISIFKTAKLTREELDQYDPGFGEFYLGPPDKPYKFLFQAVQGMFHYLKDVLKELNYLYSPFLKPLLQSVFGNITYAKPPLTEAEYQLSLYDYKLKNGETPNILNDLIYFTMEYSKDPLQQPLTGQLSLPESMR